MYVLSLIKVGFYSSPTEGDELISVSDPYETQAFGWITGLSGVEDDRQMMDCRTLWTMTVVTEECSMALYVGSWLWQKWVTVGYQVLQDQTHSFTIESS